MLEPDAIRDRRAVVTVARERDDLFDERGVVVGGGHDCDAIVSNACAGVRTRRDELSDVADLRRRPHRVERNPLGR